MGVEGKTRLAAAQPQMLEDSADDLRVFDAGDGSYEKIRDRGALESPRGLSLDLADIFKPLATGSARPAGGAKSPPPVNG